jgi:hypothetical protein
MVTYVASQSGLSNVLFASSDGGGLNIDNVATGTFDVVNLPSTFTTQYWTTNGFRAATIGTITLTTSSGDVTLDPTGVLNLKAGSGINLDASSGDIRVDNNIIPFAGTSNTYDIGTALLPFRNTYASTGNFDVVNADEIRMTGNSNDRIYDNTGTIYIDMDNAQLNDGTVSVEWVVRELRAGGVPTLNWNSRLLTGGVWQVSSDAVSGIDVVNYQTMTNYVTGAGVPSLQAVTDVGASTTNIVSFPNGIIVAGQLIDGTTNLITVSQISDFADGVTNVIEAGSFAMDAGTTWDFALASVTNIADSGNEIVNWITLTNHLAGSTLNTNSSPTMADGTTWTFETMIAETGTVTDLSATLATIDQGRFKQEVFEVITNDVSLTLDDGGKVYIVNGTAEVTVDLPTNITASTVGTDFRFINITTNLLTLDAYDTDYIDDSSLGAQIYSGVNGTNYYPFSSLSLKQGESNWWHVLSARGDWTTTGTNVTVVMPPPVRGIGGLHSMTAGVTNQTVSYGATYTTEMWPVVTLTSDATFQATPEIVSYSQSNFVFRLRGASSFVTNGWDVIWNANPAP